MGSVKNISLVGFMASGKTTVGKQLAKKLGFEFVDTDDLAEKLEGRTISSMFENSGEEYFRDVESGILGEVLSESGKVISTGGGIILREENIRALRGNSIVVWLKASRDTVLKNLKRSEDKRPLMKQCEAEERIDAILPPRLDKYKRAAHITVDVDGKSRANIVSEILFNIKKI